MYAPHAAYCTLCTLTRLPLRLGTLTQHLLPTAARVPHRSFRACGCRWGSWPTTAASEVSSTQPLSLQQWRRRWSGGLQHCRNGRAASPLQWQPPLHSPTHVGHKMVLPQLRQASTQPRPSQLDARLQPQQPTRRRQRVQGPDRSEQRPASGTPSPSQSQLQDTSAAAAAWRAALLPGGPRRQWADDEQLISSPGPRYDLPRPALLSAEVLQARLHHAVNAEVEKERAEVSSLYKMNTIARLQEAGLVLLNLKAAPDGSLLGNPVWRLTTANGGRLPDHRFSKRKAVLLSAATPGRKGEEPDFRSFPATILDVASAGVRVVVEPLDSYSMQSLVTAARRSDPRERRLLWRVDDAILDATTKRQRAAIDELPKLQRKSLAESNVRQIILGSPQAQALAQAFNPWARDPSFQAAIKAQLPLHSELNHSQKLAVGRGLLSTFTLWQGPPGTGKTRTLLAMIRIMCAVAAQRGRDSLSEFGPILATAGTNAAADNLLEGLVRDSGLRVVRVGQAANVREELRGFCLAALAAQTPEAAEARSLQQMAKLDQAAAKGSGQATLTPAQRQEAESAAKEKTRRASALVKAAEELVLDRAQVVVATCASAGEGRLAGRLYRMLVIDEATQATEPTTLIPMVKGVELCVMAGDPQQLPPTVKSQEAAACQLDRTLFERIAETPLQREARLAPAQAGGTLSLEQPEPPGLVPTLLDTQYRMHPKIAAFPSWAFYGSLLKTGVPPAERPLPQGLAWPNPEVPVAFVSCESGTDSRDDSSSGGSASFQNRDEAELALRVTELLLAGGDVDSAAILTPYAGQVRLLMRLARANTALADVSISSVDAYQGREADVVVFTTVRCNDEGSIGFVRDYRRLNVAITRPRRGLVVVGSAATLTSDSMWRDWLGWVRRQRAVMSPSDLPTSRADKSQNLRPADDAVLDRA